jgi:hypothetical protein
MEVRINPPLKGLNIPGVPSELDAFVLASRNKGENLFQIKDWPVYVHVAILKQVAIDQATDLIEGDALYCSTGVRFIRTKPVHLLIKSPSSDPRAISERTSSNRTLELLDAAVDGKVRDGGHRGPHWAIYKNQK